MPYPTNNFISATRLKNVLREKEQRNSELKAPIFAKNRNYLSYGATKTGASSNPNMSYVINNSRKQIGENSDLQMVQDHLNSVLTSVRDRHNIATGLGAIEIKTNDESGIQHLKTGGASPKYMYAPPGEDLNQFSTKRNSEKLSNNLYSQQHKVLLGDTLSDLKSMNKYLFDSREYQR